MQYGAIVRTPIKELWENEESQGKIGVSHVYGIVPNRDDHDERSTLSALCVNWATDHLIIPENNIPYNLYCGIDETKLELLMYRHDNINSNINYPFENYFEKDCRGEWSIKLYIPICEFCGEVRCDRMEQKEILEDMIDDLKLDG